MLDIMRQQKRMKAIVLWVVIIAVGLSMVVWGVALNLGGGSDRSGRGSYAAIVGDRTISTQEFLDTYEQSTRYLRENSREELDPELLKSLGLSQQVLQRLIRGRIVEILAERLGISVSPGEVRQAILNLPGMQVDGKFIGMEQYKLRLSSNRIPVEAFEEDIRYSLLSEKLTRVLTDSLEVSDRELREEYSRLHQTATVSYVLLREEGFKKRVQPADGDLEAYFEEHKDAYRVKEKRRAEYLLVPTSKLLPGIEVSEQEIRDEWEKNPAPETVEAAHILFLVQSPDEEEAVRARAASVLEQIKAGGDFAALAQKHSQDTGSADQGGYLGAFPRGRMVEEFEDAVFSLEPGAVSDLVRTPDYGYHIIKVFRHDTPSLESNRNELMNSVRLSKAKEAARQKAQEAANIALAKGDLGSIGAELNLETEVRETALFGLEDNPYSLGLSQALRDAIFQIEEIGSTGKVVEHTMGYAFAKLLEIQQARPGQFEESREQVTKDFIEKKAGDLMEAEARKLSAESRRLGSLLKAAGSMGYKVQTSPDFKIDESPGPEITRRDAFNAAAFGLDPGNVSEPVLMADSAAVLEVLARTPFDETAFEAEKEALRERMFRNLQETYLEAYFRSYSEKLEEEGKIRMNPEVLDLVERLHS